MWAGKWIGLAAGAWLGAVASGGVSPPVTPPVTPPSTPAEPGGSTDRVKGNTKKVQEWYCADKTDERERREKNSEQVVNSEFAEMLGNINEEEAYQLIAFIVSFESEDTFF